MKNLVGYALAVFGLVVLAIGLGTFGIKLGFLGNFGSTTIAIVGGVLIVVGVVFLRFFGEGGSNNKVKQEKEEVPIYKGDKIVGYRRESK